MHPAVHGHEAVIVGTLGILAVVATLIASYFYIRIALAAGRDAE